MSAPRVLLLEDGHSPYVLAAARALGATGARVGHGGPRRDSRVVRSRWVHRSHPVPAPERDLDGFVAGINAAVAQEGYEVVLPGDDADLLALSATRDRVEAVVPYAEHPVVLAAVDKLALTAAAAAAGVAVPATVEATDDAVAAIDRPRVVKPALHWTPGGGATSRHLPVSVCDTAAAARRAVRRIRDAGGRALLQEPVAGDLMAMTGVVDERGQLLGVVQQWTPTRSLRDKSARAETVAVEEDLRAAVERLTAGMGWRGLANLQFLRPPGGRPHLIDFNGRCYGSMALGAAAGVNLASVWVETALGRSPGPLGPARVGVRFQSLEEDLRRARRQRRGGLLRDVAETLAYAPRATHVTWSARDPRPGLVAAARVARAVVRGS